MIAFLSLIALLLTQNPAGARDGVVMGHLRTADGAPAAQLRVAAIAMDGADERLSGVAETDAEGNYRLSEVPPGRYYIVAGRLDTPTYYPGTSKPAGARMVTVTAGAVTAGVDFSMRQLPAISGRVVGIPPASWLIETQTFFLRLEPVLQRRESRRSPIAPDGRFEFRDLANGDYRLRLMGLPFDYLTIMVRVDGADIRGIDLPSPPLVFGRIEAEERNGGSAELSADVLRLLRLDVSDAAGEYAERFPAYVDITDGSFVLALPADDDYRLSMRSGASGYDVKSIISGSADLLKNPLHFSSETSVPGIRVTLIRTADQSKNLPSPGIDIWSEAISLFGRPRPPGCGSCSAPVNGRLTGGTPAPSAIQLVNTGALHFLDIGKFTVEVGTRFEAPVDADGRFAFPAVPFGIYEIRLLPPSHLPIPLPPLNVDRRADLQNLEIPIPSPRAFSGRVVPDGGVVLPDGAAMELGVRRAATASESILVPIEPDGAFSLLLPQGGYALSIIGLPPRFTVKSITYGAADLLRGPLKVDDSPTAEILIRVIPE